MSTIRELTRDAARAYPDQAGPIVDALERREVAMRATIMQGGRELGAPEREINRILDAAGLGVLSDAGVSSTASSNGDGGGSKNQRIAELERRVGELEEIANRARRAGQIR